MEGTLVERAREHRSSGAVLKTRLSNLRSRHPSIPVFIFEGQQDLGPYEVWISRMYDDFDYEPLPGAGKGQLLDLRRRLRSDKGGLSIGVYFFIDRDFDDLRGEPPGGDVYCTEAYSVENYLVSEMVLWSLLTDEFGCTAESDERDAILGRFKAVADQFSQEIRAPNLRLFVSRRLGVDCAIGDSISRYITIDLESVRTADGGGAVSALVKPSREPTQEEIEALEIEFRDLDPMMRYRGKFWMELFQRWLRKLAEARRSGDPRLFSERKPVSDGGVFCSMRSLAARSAIPAGLREFLRDVA